MQQPPQIVGNLAGQSQIGDLQETPLGGKQANRCPLAMEVCRKASPPLVGIGPGRRVACFAVTPEAMP